MPAATGTARWCKAVTQDPRPPGFPPGASRSPRRRLPHCRKRPDPPPRTVPLLQCPRSPPLLHPVALLLLPQPRSTYHPRTRPVVTMKQSESLVVCDVAEDLVEKLRKFRFRKETNNAAIIMKIDKDKRLVVLDEELEGISPDELKDELPERQPRFIVYSYKYQHDDGRVSYPLCFIFSSPVGCKPEQQMMYAGSKNKLVQTAELTKVFEIRNTEDLTEEWLREKLGFFH
nr:glia maturation factor beta [Dasypus novemcinctus]